MPRSSRIVIENCAHHVTQRGNNRQDVFFVDDDRRAFLMFLAEASERFGLAVEGYCLMTNHVHLVATPSAESSLAEALKRTNQLYAQYVNRLHGRSGHLWQDRFFSCPLDEVHRWRALVYIVGIKGVRYEWRFLRGLAETKSPVRGANLYEFASVAIVGIDATNRTHK